jgi:bifunctional DNA-binding transcriptional regulator/antitoxin component of YhaV-PrlF toxin-antitoxin module
VKAKCFTKKFVCRLDRKFRLVLPVTIREKLGISNLVLLGVDGNLVVIRKIDRESKLGLAISKNCEEVRDILI